MDLIVLCWSYLMALIVEAYATLKLQELDDVLAET